MSIWDYYKLTPVERWVIMLISECRLIGELGRTIQTSQPLDLTSKEEIGVEV